MLFACDLPILKKQTDMHIRSVNTGDIPSWLRMRVALWPDESEAEHREAITAYFNDPGKNTVFLAVHDSGRAVGFLEFNIRAYAEGCQSDRVGFIEGWYVEPAFQRQGIGRALVAFAEQWALNLGCTEMASDAVIDNTGSIAAHRRLGYEEVVRVVCFRKHLQESNILAAF